jgi:hypothetical protein
MIGFFRAIELLAVLLDVANVLSYLATVPAQAGAWLVLVFLAACLVVAWEVWDRSQ